MKRPLKKKQNELLHNALGLKTADLQARNKRAHCACTDVVKPNFDVQLLFMDKPF